MLWRGVMPINLVQLTVIYSMFLQADRIWCLCQTCATSKEVGINILSMRSRISN